jgi:hypothetical protein
MKKGKLYHWKWKQEGNIDNRESANYKNMREQKKKLPIILENSVIILSMFWGLSSFVCTIWATSFIFSSNKILYWKLPDMCKKQSSFCHFNNRDKSQINYFVENNLRVKKYWTFEREFTNLSTTQTKIKGCITFKRIAITLIPPSGKGSIKFCSLFLKHIATPAVLSSFLVGPELYHMGLEKSTLTISPTLCKLDDVHSILNVLSFNIEG